MLKLSQALTYNSDLSTALKNKVCIPTSSSLTMMRSKICNSSRCVSVSCSMQKRRYSRHS